MRRATLSFVLILSMTVPAFAQEWTEYQNVEYGFRVNFPGQPRTTDITWTSEFGYPLPARVFTADRGAERYSVTVVDYGPIEAQGIARRKACPPGAETCIGSDLSGPGHWKHDVRGALIFATGKFLQRNARLTHYLWNHQDLVEGHELQMTSNADESRTFVFIGMHEMKLYVLEGTVPKGAPEPALFQASAGWLDKDGNGIRYQMIYANQYFGLKELPLPQRAGGGRGAGGGQGGRGGRGAGGAGNAQ